MNLDTIVDALCHNDTNNILRHVTPNDTPMPSVDDLQNVVSNLTSVLFPGFFGHADLTSGNMKYYIGATLDRTFGILTEQIHRGFCFACTDSSENCKNCPNDANALAEAFFDRLPHIKNLLSTDVIAAYNGDPASTGYAETIYCYPSITALTHFRMAHELLLLGVPLIPRIITELAHARTGIDIHPGATIAPYFFIDHGTGVVIGETTIIGKNVRLYQGVTLGARSFPLDENGKPIKGIARHPIVEDDVIIYSNATILGRITIGKGAVIGGNMWVTKDVEAGEKILFR